MTSCFKKLVHALVGQVGTMGVFVNFPHTGWRMHLKTCAKVRVLRRGSKYRCSHCMGTLKLSRSGPYMILVKIVNCYLIKMCYLIIYCYLKLIQFFA